MHRLAPAALAALSLTACGTLDDMRVANETNIGLCPNVFALEDAARMIEFSGDPALENVAWSAEIQDVRTSCRYVEDRPIEARIEIDFAVGRGPAATETVRNVEYFVAVTRRNRALIAKEVFTVPVKIQNGVASVRFTEDIKEIVIPRKDSDTSGSNFEIAVGFTLTRDQVIYNRSGQSLKFPNL